MFGWKAGSRSKGGGLGFRVFGVFRVFRVFMVFRVFIGVFIRVFRV